MVDLPQGFVLTRHWRDTATGTEVEFWLATDAGPRRVRLPHQPSVAFIPAEQRDAAERLLHDEKNVELRPLALQDAPAWLQSHYTFQIRTFWITLAALGAA